MPSPRLLLSLCLLGLFRTLASKDNDILCNPSKSSDTMCYLNRLVVDRSITLEIDCSLDQYNVVAEQISISGVPPVKTQPISFKIFETCVEKNPKFKFK